MSTCASDTAPRPASNPIFAPAGPGHGTVVGVSGAEDLGGQESSQQPLLTPSQRHLVTRFGYGVDARSPGTYAVRAARRRGSRSSSTRPGAFADGAADAVRRWWPDLDRKPADLWQRQVQEVRGGWEVMEDYGRWLLVRRIRTRRPVLEKMTEFWEGMLHVPVSGDAHFTWRADYGDTIRAPRARALRPAARRDHHPPGDADLPVGGDVDQAGAQREPRSRAARAAHAGRRQLQRGRRQGLVAHPHRLARRPLGDVGGVLRQGGPLDRPGGGRGFRDTNSKGDGREVTREYLRYLAHHPRHRPPRRRAAGDEVRPRRPATRRS